MIFYVKNIIWVCNMSQPLNLGKYSYGTPVICWDVTDAKLSIGNFCSIGTNVKIYLGNGVGHDARFVSTYPFGYIQTSIFPNVKNLSRNTNGDVVIGNDVWIGANVTIMSGVKVGDGAVIANNSHVIKDVESYSLIGGNPANHIRSRFKSPQIEELLKIKWWNWSDEKINKYTGLLMNPDVDKFIRAVQADDNN
jgi:acetyltransferase-like isoleucine patch superfamily enzyme